MATCQERNDQRTNEVSMHVYGFISDLHAANAGYHADCASRFMGSRAVRALQTVKEVSKLRTEHSQQCPRMLLRMFHM